MTETEKAIRWMENVANDPAHGYDQTFRWGEKGDYDCSSAVITAWQQAGVPVRSEGATYTGNMYDVFIGCGFVDVTKSVNLSTGNGMRRGDVLLNHRQHTAMYCGEGKEVEASINEHGKATGGKPGDQTDKEFLIRTYRNYPWDCVLRYIGVDAVKFNAASNQELPKPNGFPPRTLSIGDKGVEVYLLQSLLAYRGYNIEIDGDFGAKTRLAVMGYQAENGMLGDGVCTNDVWSALTK